MDFMHILGQKEATWNTIFSIFERRWAPKRRGARENFPPFPPLSTGLSVIAVCRIFCVYVNVVWSLI